MYNEAQAVKLALRNHVIEAISAEYIEPLRNATTDMINDSIPVIITFLGANYGRITPGKLKEKESVIYDLVYEYSTNVDTVLNKIQHFQGLCTLTGNTGNDTQLITYTNLVFQKTGIFM